MKGSCEVCQEIAAKYRCPACQTQTCCLQCVRQHKTDKTCDGQRDKTAFVAVSDFKNIHLLSASEDSAVPATGRHASLKDSVSHVGPAVGTDADYRFLEDGGRMKTNSERDKLNKQATRPHFLKELGKNAAARKIDLKFMPYPMSKRRNNTTTYQYRNKCIMWRIEWKFPQSDVTVVDKRVPEGDTLEDILSRHFGEEADPIVKHRLKAYTEAGQDQWGVFMEVQNRPQADKRYYRLDLQKNVTDNLAHKCVVEFPTLEVVLQPHWQNYNTDFIPEEFPEKSIEPTESKDTEDKPKQKKPRRHWHSKNKNKVDSKQS